MALNSRAQEDCEKLDGNVTCEMNETSNSDSIDQIDGNASAGQYEQFSGFSLGEELVSAVGKAKLIEVCIFCSSVYL